MDQRISAVERSPLRWRSRVWYFLPPTSHAAVPPRSALCSRALQPHTFGLRAGALGRVASLGTVSRDMSSATNDSGTILPFCWLLSTLFTIHHSPYL